MQVGEEIQRSEAFEIFKNARNEMNCDLFRMIRERKPGDVRGGT